MELYKHQQDFITKNPDKAILAWEAGTGKTRAAIEWASLRPDFHPIVICTKAIKVKWFRDMVNWGYEGDYTIYTKEEFKKAEIPQGKYLLIVDEAHNFSSPLYFAKLRSQLSTKLFQFIQENLNMPRLLLTANPVRSSPANLHTLLTFAGYNAPWDKWKDKFYTLIRRPYLPRPAWEPVKGWQKQMVPIIEKYCHVALMKDCADVPIHEHQVSTVLLNDKTLEAIKKLDLEEWEPMKKWCGEHRLENGVEKLEWIKDYAKGRRKVVIICKYTDQILQYAKELARDRETFILNGATKDQGQVIKDAQESPECFLIVQAQVSAGYDLDSFSTMIFASCSWSWVDHSQCHGRINRMHNLHRNEYIYLVSGEKDLAILESLEAKKDFDVNKIVKNIDLDF